jgi:antibiotic biosynthesis monooxygenase (ABM) superfamily enzyme|eukprot:Stramenopile-MAST_4_protein_2015
MGDDNQKLLMAPGLQTASGLSKSGNRVVTSEDQVTAFLHMRAKVKADKPKLDKWLHSILQASQQWQEDAWAGRIVLRPPEDGLDYVIMFRFKTHRLMENWLRSPERLHWVKNLDEMNIAETVDKDLQEGTVAFMPERMVDAAWASLAGQKLLSPDVKKSVKTKIPPPKWRNVIVIWLSLQMTVLPWAYTLGPMMHNAGVPPALNLFFTLICVVITVKWLLIPCLDRLLHCFLFAKRCPAVEPCLSLQIGCACCRPGQSTAVDPHTERLNTLEQQLQNVRRINGAGRRRLLERIENLEEIFSDGNSKMETVGDIAIDIASQSDVVANESEALLGIPAIHETVEPTGDDAVTVTIGYNVKLGYDVQFEDWLHEISRTAATRVQGHRGALLISTPEHVRSRIRKPLSHIIMFQFDTQEHLHEWATHPARHELVDRLRPILADASLTEVRVASYDSFSDLFENVNADQAPRGENVHVVRRDPQTWKSACVLVASLFFVIMYFVGPIIEPMLIRISSGEKWFVVMGSTFLNVCLLAYIMLPIFVPRCGNWLFAPWVESDNCIVALCQRGFSCFDTVGEEIKSRRSER